jgi:hypothetical protein
VIESSDNGLIMAGNTQPIPSGTSPFDVVLVKTDSAGVMLWAKTYASGVVSDSLDSAIEHSTDNGIVIAGATETASVDNFMLMKTDSAGVEQWTKTYGGGSNDDRAFCVIEHSIDNGFVLAGETYSFVLVV